MLLAGSLCSYLRRLYFKIRTAPRLDVIKERIFMDKTTINGVELTLMPPVTTDDEWVDYGQYLQQLEAAWLRLSKKEPPLNPRLIGEPGLGKTTLACAVARVLQTELYIFQCTMDTRPEDLVITPVVTGNMKIEYRASSVVTAMIRGGILVLDEGNRMPERTWAALAPLLDGRRYMDSAIAAIRIPASPDFHICVTMNDDSSVFELPGYIQSRLKPKIELVPPPWKIKEGIVRLKCPGVDADLLKSIFSELKERATQQCRDSIRDILSLAQYAQKLRNKGIDQPLAKAVEQILARPDASASKA
jgi:MoxR-like ATPase